MAEIVTSYRAKLQAAPKVFLEGTIAIDNNNVISWTPTATGAANAVSFPISSIKDHKRSSSTSPRPLLRFGIVRQSSDDPQGKPLEAVYVFEFSAAPERDAFSEAVNARSQALQPPLAQGTPAAGMPRVVSSASVGASSSAAGSPALSARSGGTSSAVAGTGTPGGAGAGAGTGGNGRPPARAAAVAPPPVITAEVAAQRAKLLGSNRALLDLHTKLVVSGVVSEHEFWQSRTELLQAEERKSQQKVGIPNAMIADVRPTTDGRANKVHFKLTPEIIRQLFVEKPAVHKAYLANVPDKMDEKKFWKKYMRFEYFNRMRGAGGVQAQASASDYNEDDEEDAALFAPDLEATSQANLKKAKKADPLVNIIATMDDSCVYEGYGTRDRAGRDKPDVKGPVKETYLGETRLIHDLNRHAEVVLQGRDPDSGRLTAAAPPAATPASERTTNGVGGGSNDNEEAVPDEAVRRRLEEVTRMEDLQPPPAPAYVPLNIQDPRMYFDRAIDGAEPAPATVAAAAEAAPSSGAAPPQPASPTHDGRAWFLEQLQVIPREVRPGAQRDALVTEALAAQVLKDVQASISSSLDGPSGAATVGPAASSAASLPKVVADKLLDAASTAEELLRHFWRSYPIRSAAVASKVNRVKDAMGKLYDDLQATKEQMPTEYRTAVFQLVQPTLQALDAAFAKYEAESRKILAKRKQVPGSAGIAVT
eukprot:jgi/Mesvir1/25194/Mv12891-RA.2